VKKEKKAKPPLRVSENRRTGWKWGLTVTKRTPEKRRTARTPLDHSSSIPRAEVILGDGGNKTGTAIGIRFTSGTIILRERFECWL